MVKYLQKGESCKRYGLANPESKCRYCGRQLVNPKPPKFSAPSARILMYLYGIYTYKFSFLSLLAPQAKIFGMCTLFRSDFAIKNDHFQREDENLKQIFLLQV